MTIGKERCLNATNGMADIDIAIKFYNTFDVKNNFGSLITNEEFNQWIYDHQFANMHHGWESKNSVSAWNHHRRIIRNYIKNGVMSQEYAELGFEPFCLEIKEHGQSLIVTRFEDYVVDSFRKLASNRQKNIKNKDKTLKKDFKVLTEIYEVDRVDAIMQNGIIDAQNKMRLAFEKSCGEILQTTVEETIKTITETQNTAKRIAHDYTERQDQSIFGQ